MYHPYKAEQKSVLFTRFVSDVSLPSGERCSNKLFLLDLFNFVLRWKKCFCVLKK